MLSGGRAPRIPSPFLEETQLEKEVAKESAYLEAQGWDSRPH
jgi:hypothetical protein